MRHQLPYHITRPLSIYTLCGVLIFESAASGKLPFAALPPGHPMPDAPHQDHSPGPPNRLVTIQVSTSVSTSLGGIIR
jgi:hypothetical protein